MTGRDPVPLDAVNRMSPTAFVGAFGNVAEHSPWVAEAAAVARPFAHLEAMMSAFERSVRAASPGRQLALLNAHPDLAGKAAIAGNLTDDSRREQAGAGLGSLTPDEFVRFTELNDAYKARFGFPFILAVEGATKQQILAAFEERIGNPFDEEVAAALAQVCRIVRLRLARRVAA